jgi:hypothetical protein
MFISTLWWRHHLLFLVHPTASNTVHLFLINPIKTGSCCLAVSKDVLLVGYVSTREKNKPAQPFSLPVYRIKAETTVVPPRPLAVWRHREFPETHNCLRGRHIHTSLPRLICDSWQPHRSRAVDKSTDPQG